MGKIATENEASQIGFAGTSESIVLPEPNKCVTRGRLSALNCQVSILHSMEYDSDNQLVQLEHIQKKGGGIVTTTKNYATITQSPNGTTWEISFTYAVASTLTITINATDKNPDKPTQIRRVTFNKGNKTQSTNILISQYNMPTIDSIVPLSDSSYQYISGISVIG